MKKRKISKELDKDIEKAISETIGNEVIPVVKVLKNKKDISEFKLAEKLKLEINDVRNIIYKLDSYGLVSSIRKKDKKKGWYIYYWTFNEGKALSIVIMIKQRELNRLREELKLEEKKIFFVCPNKCTRVDIETAMDYQYVCQECGNLMVQDDTVKRLKVIAKKITDLENELSKLKELIQI
ncbi:MAG: hypothetical protein AB1571_02110 [Nanoarchaeota archaeon]